MLCHWGRAPARTRNLASITSSFQARAESAHPGMTAVEARRLASPSPEIRNAAFGGGFDAFLEIFGGAQFGLLDQFVIGGGEHAVGEAGAHGGTGRDQAERRTLGNFLG